SYGDWSSDVCSSDLLSRQMMDDLQGAPAHDRITAQHVRMEPLAGHRAVGENLFPDHLVDGRVFIHQQANQRGSLTLGQSLRCFRSEERRVGKECGAW